MVTNTTSPLVLQSLEQRLPRRFCEPKVSVELGAARSDDGCSEVTQSYLGDVIAPPPEVVLRNHALAKAGPSLTFFRQLLNPQHVTQSTVLGGRCGNPRRRTGDPEVFSTGYDRVSTTS